MFPYSCMQGLEVNLSLICLEALIRQIRYSLTSFHEPE